MKTVETFCSNFPRPANKVGRWSAPVYAYHVPIELREYALKLFREEGISIKLRYRGSRKASIGRVMKRKPDQYNTSSTYIRTRGQSHQDCLLQDAVSFTIYRR